MKKTILVGIAFCVAVLCNAQDGRFDKLDAELEKINEDWHAAGFAVAVVEKDSVIYQRGFGYKDYENGEPVTPNTLFAIGSCSKAFTSSILGILREEKKVDFDKSPIDYIHELRFFNEDMNRNIRIRDLMCHRTGLPRHDVSWYLFPTDSKDSLISRIQYQEPTAELRQTWQYNNFMFLAQGVLAERITDMSWEENVSTKLFEPLGMENSNFSIDALEASSDFSYGYGVKEDSLVEKTDYYRIRAMGPAGSINSSVVEMSNWLKCWINGGLYEGEQVIPKSYVNEAMSSQMIVRGTPPDKDHPEVHIANYGMGWFISSYRGHYRVEHGGNIDGFSANTCFFPSDSIGIVVLANQNGSSIPTIVRNLVADRMLGLEYHNWSEELLKDRNEAQAQSGDDSNQKKDRITGTQMSHEVSDYVGTFGHPGYGKVQVSEVNDSLFARTPHLNFYLSHYHYDVFKPYVAKDGDIDTSDFGGPSLLMNFSTNNLGEIDALSIVLEAGLDPIKFKREHEILDIEEEALQEYAGEYELSGLTAKVYVEGGTLFVLVPGQPDYELAAIGDDRFKLTSLEGYHVQFNRSEKGSIASLSFIQPNGTFTATRKE